MADALLAGGPLAGVPTVVLGFDGALLDAPFVHDRVALLTVPCPHEHVHRAVGRLLAA